MGTVMNGKKWSGVCINGKTIGGIVKNGSMLYKKMNSLIYKRRIMLNDNLRNLTIYSNFQENHYENIITRDTYNYIIICNQSKNDSIYEEERFLPGGIVDLVTSTIIDQEFFYKYDIGNQTELQNNAKCNNDKDYIVTSILELESYRCLYIKDPNIRPLKIGDKLTSGTKLYFIFPDDFFKKIKIYQEDYSDVITTKDDFLIMNYLDNSNIGLHIFIQGKSQFIYQYDLENGYLKYNLSSYTCKFSATITNINDRYGWDKYMFVDKTTLGN